MHGLCSLRFDLSGLGDSRAAIQSQEFRAQSVADLQAAMDMMSARYGVKRFALIGVCSGAISIYEAAVMDKRVLGILMFDGYCYLTRWTKWVKYWKRARTATLSDWIASAQTRLARLRRTSPGGAGAQADIVSPYVVTPNPPKETFAREMQRLVDRGAAVFVVFSGSFIDYYSYANQFRDAFDEYGFVRRIRCEYRSDIDHTFVMLETQRKMLDLLSSWVPDVERAAGPAG